MYVFVLRCMLYSIKAVAAFGVAAISAAGLTGQAAALKSLLQGSGSFGVAAISAAGLTGQAAAFNSLLQGSGSFSLCGIALWYCLL